LRPPPTAFYHPEDRASQRILTEEGFLALADHGNEIAEEPGREEVRSTHAQAYV
jgi:hypothetical protein